MSTKDTADLPGDCIFFTRLWLAFPGVKVGGAINIMTEVF